MEGCELSIFAFGGATVSIQSISRTLPTGLPRGEGRSVLRGITQKFRGSAYRGHGSDGRLSAVVAGPVHRKLSRYVSPMFSVLSALQVLYHVKYCSLAFCQRSGLSSSVGGAHCSVFFIRFGEPKWPNYGARRKRSSYSSVTSGPFLTINNIQHTT